MPDHVHFFVRGNPDFVLSSWVGGLKRAMSVAGLNQSHGTRLPIQRKSLWQPGFFDHVLRNDESYAQKWEYVRENPVRGGIVGRRDRSTTHARKPLNHAHLSVCFLSLHAL